MLLLRTTLFLALLLIPPLARADGLGSADTSAITSVIERQLQAFQKDDDATAYAQAAPMIKFAYPTVETFIAMVKQGYQPVYRNNGHAFKEMVLDNAGRPMQRVIIEGADGKRYEALYTMEKQGDGAWKIAGCRIMVLPGQEV